MDEAKLAQVAHILGTHGVKGCLKIHPVTDDLELIGSLEEAWVWGGSPGTSPVKVQVASVREAHKHWLFQFEGVDSMEQAQQLCKKALWVPEEQLRPLAEGEFFIHQVVGAQAFDTTGEPLGEVVNCFENGPQLIFEIADIKGGRFLVPSVGELIKEIDPAQGRVVLELPEGLRDLNHKGD